MKFNHKYEGDYSDKSNPFQPSVALNNIETSYLICNKNQMTGFYIPEGNYMFKVTNGITRTRCEICSKLTIKALEWSQWSLSGVFIVNFEHNLHLVLLFLL